MSQIIAKIAGTLVFEPDKAIVLGTGPSLIDGIAVIREEDFTGTIFALKQALDYIPLDFKGQIIHLLNPWNFKQYQKHPSCYCTLYYHDSEAKFCPPQSSYDFKFETTYEIPKQLDTSLLATREFADGMEFRSSKRPLMPGIFPEALFLAAALGCREIRLFGVDYSQYDPQNSFHVYENSSSTYKVMKLLSKPLLVKRMLHSLGWRTQFSHGTVVEHQVAIPGLTSLITFLGSRGISVLGWKHNADSNA